MNVTWNAPIQSGTIYYLYLLWYCFKIFPEAQTIWFVGILFTLWSHTGCSMIMTLYLATNYYARNDIFYWFRNCMDIQYQQVYLPPAWSEIVKFNSRINKNSHCSASPSFTCHRELLSFGLFGAIICKARFHGVRRRPFAASIAGPSAPWMLYMAIVWVL